MLPPLILIICCSSAPTDQGPNAQTWRTSATRIAPYTQHPSNPSHGLLPWSALVAGTLNYEQQQSKLASQLVLRSTCRGNGIIARDETTRVDRGHRLPRQRPADSNSQTASFKEDRNLGGPGCSFDCSCVGLCLQGKRGRNANATRLSRTCWRGCDHPLFDLCNSYGGCLSISSCPASCLCDGICSNVPRCNDKCFQQQKNACASKCRDNDEDAGIVEPTA